MNWKKIFSYMVTIAKIISFISLCLSVYIKVRALVGTKKPKENTDVDDDNDNNDDDSPVEPEDIDKTPRGSHGNN